MYQGSPILLPALSATRRRILLLQGPVGPFFKRLQDYLQANGHSVWRVCFNPADSLFSSAKNRVTYRGGLDDWPSWFADFLDAMQIDCIVLFGAGRPVHAVARQVAARNGVQVIALEEGYLRPGYVTVEEGGNNDTSPLAGRLPGRGFDLFPTIRQSPRNYASFRAMGVYATIYYGLRTISTVGRQRQLFHRNFTPAKELGCWIRNGYRRLAGRTRNYAKIENLLEHHDGNYFLVPLQVAADCQMKQAARGWSSTRLISAALKSFSRTAPDGTRLVFKVHPLDRGHSNHRKLIEDTARAFGIDDRVDVIDIGSIGLLTRHAAGMITINSTSGLSAIFHGTPLLVIGDAIYAHPALATCAMGEPDFDAFWTNGRVANATLRKSYIEWIRHSALKPGDFYAAAGMKAACEGILAKLRAMPVEYSPAPPFQAVS